MSDAKTRFLQAGERLFRRQGYAGSGLKELIKEAQAPSGSLYYYFPDGKEQLGSEVIGYAATLYAKGLRGPFEHFADPVDAVRRIFENEIKTLERSDYRDGCPIASVTSDIASTNETLRTACAAAFALWLETIAAGFVRAGETEPAAAALAAFFLSALEGAIILSRAAKSPAPLQHTGELVVLALKSHRAGAQRAVA
jgi:TetR/AcrR family transcriptional repressor of lmrAB and yxaGH operons